jgi:predicted ATPase
VAELARLLLAEPDCRLLTLVGPGGMGKTRLALKVAGHLVDTHAQHGKFADGFFFVPLEAVTDASGIVSAIISVIAEESGFPLHAAAPLQEQMLDFLGNTAMVLLLDNFEHLVKSAELLSAILRAAPGVKILVTSREALGLQEAWFYPLVGMSVPKDGEAQKPKVEHDAVRFFIQCARRTQPGFAPEDERAAIVRICQMVDGMPLAIEMAAAWLKVLTCPEIVEELERGLDILTARFQNIPARHSSMRAVMEQSWRMLADNEREVAARLSVFRGGFGQQAANEVAGASLPILASLVEKALLRVRPDRRYQMHELTRQYATEHVAQVRELRDAHGRYYAKFCQRLTAHLYDAQSKAMLDDFALVADNILAAWHWLIQTVAEGASHPLAANWLAQMIPPMAEWYYAKAFFQAGQQIFAQAVATLTGAGWTAVPPTDTLPAPEQTLLAQLHIRIGMLTYELGQFDLVAYHVERVLPLLHAWDNAAELALALALLGKANYRRGRRSEARTQLDASLRHAQAAQDLLGCAIALNNLSHIAQDEGNHAESERLLRECLAIYQTMDLASGIGSTLGNLGYSYAMQGDHEKALVYYRQAMTVAEAQDDPLTIMVIISNMAASHRALGQREAAIGEHQQSLRMARDQGNLRWVASNLNGLSHVYFELHDYTAATRHLSEGLAIADKIASIADALETISLYAQVWAQQGHMIPALRALSFIIQYPATADRTKRSVQALLDELTAELPPAVVSQARSWATAQTMDEVVAWVETIDLKRRI